MDGLTRTLRRVPLAILCALVGLAASAAVPRLSLAVTPELVLGVLLPGLVFEAAYRLRWEDLRRSYGFIAFLAVPGVFLSAYVVAVVLAVTTGLRLDLAFVVGAMVSATDPAAVVATFARLGAPRRLVAIVDAESLLNDGTGLLLFAIAVRSLGGGVVVVDAAVSFVAISVGSALIGLAIGAAAAHIVVRLRDHRAQVFVSLIAAYGASAAAVPMGLSSIISTVVAGVILGNYGRRIGLVHGTEAAFDTAWERVSTLLTAVIFFVVGLAIGPTAILSALGPIWWGVLAVLAARAVVVYVMVGGAVATLGRTRIGPDLPGAWLHLMFWAGLRGAVATAAALSLPATIPERELLQRITFGIVLITLVAHGSTARWVLQRSGVTVDA